MKWRLEINYTEDLAILLWMKFLRRRREKKVILMAMIPVKTCKFPEMNCRFPLIMFLRCSSHKQNVASLKSSTVSLIYISCFYVIFPLGTDHFRLQEKGVERQAWSSVPSWGAHICAAFGQGLWHGFDRVAPLNGCVTASIPFYRSFISIFLFLFIFHSY